ncbi:MAG: acetolactate synthase large subunit [Alphaproteobacteria bacterium]|nr:acetolactate synthase large subunit [Alphaproteobacteria bacterium]
MNGAQAIIHTLEGAGVDVCFANPGTSEMQLVAAIGESDKMKPVLALFEGVVTGAADGYARIADKPAATLLHLGPGMANGLANTHNAKRARSASVNLIGDHALSHKNADAPLASDIETGARPFHTWVRSIQSIDTAGSDAAAAVLASQSNVPGPVALIVPADVAWTEGASPGKPLAVPARLKAAQAGIERIAVQLRDAGERGALLLGGRATTRRGIEAAGRIREAIGTRIISDTFAIKTARGAGQVGIEKLPYFAEQATEALANVSPLVTVETKPPVAFFAYPGKPGRFAAPGAPVLSLALPEEDGLAALEALAEAVGGPREAVKRNALSLPDAPRAGKLDVMAMVTSVARHLPEDAIVIDESITASIFFQGVLAGARPYDHCDLMGGAIGYGLPAATGAAIAGRGRKVVCLEGDGSALYTIQALWTQARENLDVVTVMVSNRTYAILNIEMARVGAQNPGPKALSMLRIDEPTLDIAQIARGMGVESARAETAEAFEDLFAAAMKRKGPFLIEAVL